MNPAMMLAVFSPRVLETRTFTTDSTWAAPLTTTQLETLVGQGQPVVPTSHSVFEVFYLTGGSGAIVATTPWDNIQGIPTNTRNQLNAGGNVNYSPGALLEYANGTETVSSFTLTASNVIAGSASVSYDAGWKTTGAITSDGSASVAWSQRGADASGFGAIFPGSAGGAVAPASLAAVAVTPGASYSLVVPAGASITITYYR